MFLIKIYQRTLSLDHGYLGKMFPNWRVCKFVPTCSQYFYESVKKHGSIKGTALGLRRVSRCNGKTVAGTYDPVP